MTDLILPLGISMPKAIQPKESPDAAATADQKASQLPRPQGWKILCIVPDVAEKFENSELIRAEVSRRQEEHGTTVLFVMDLGPDAYKDPAKFPSGPWCKKGDFILVRTYSGTRFKIFGKEFRSINDDMVEMVIDDPRGITRA